MYSLWFEADRFYTFRMPITLIAMAFLFFLYIFIQSYTKPKGKMKKATTIGFLAMIISSIIYFAVGHNQFGFWVEENEYINPGIREYNFVLGMKRVEEAETVKAYSHSNSLYTNLNALSMYSSELVTTPFNYTYIGSSETTHYFSFGEEDQYVFRISGEVNWDENNNEIAGWQFKLDEDQFKNIGFRDEFNTVFDSLSLTESMQTDFELEDHQQMTSMEDIFHDWIFSNQRF